MPETKRILFLADADSIWTVRYLENVLIPAGWQITLFPIYPNNGTRDDFYAKYNITVYRDEHQLPVIRHIPRIRMWARIWLNARSLIQMGPYDAVDCHYISQRDLALGAMVAKHFGAVFTAMSLGSDVLRASKTALRRMRGPLCYAKRVHVANAQSREMLSAACGSPVSEKIVVLNYGTAEYPVIERVCAAHTKADCRLQLSIPQDRFVAVIGSNASQGQRQLEMVKALSALPKEVQQRMMIILIQNYAQDSETYVQQTHDVLKQGIWQYRVITDYMTAEQYAVLQHAADLFVFGAVTDSFSSALREFLYAGAYVLKGAWLKYEQLDNIGIHINSFADDDELRRKVLQVMEGTAQPYDDNVRELLMKNTSWEGVLPKWLSAYEKE